MYIDDPSVNEWSGKTWCFNKSLSISLCSKSWMRFRVPDQYGAFHYITSKANFRSCTITKCDPPSERNKREPPGTSSPMINLSARRTKGEKVLDHHKHHVNVILNHCLSSKPSSSPSSQMHISSLQDNPANACFHATDFHGSSLSGHGTQWKPFIRGTPFVRAEYAADPAAK